MVVWNVQSLIRKVGYVMEHVKDVNADFVFLTEIWLTSQNNNVTATIKSHGYKLYHHVRDDPVKKCAGGVAIYVNNLITNFKVLNELKLDVTDCESIFLEIYLDRKTESEKTPKLKTFLLGCVYKHPRWVTDVFNNQLFEKLSIYSEKNIPILLLGDINIDVLAQGDRSKNYENTLSSVGCKNLVDIPTCFSDSSRSCVDHIITNRESNEIDHGVLDETPTDHVPIYAIYKGGNFSYKNQYKEEDEVKWRYFDDKKKGNIS